MGGRNMKGGENMSKTKEELEQLENQVNTKKSNLEYQKLEVPFQVGSAYFIRTVTYFATGRVKAIVGQFLVLDDAAWIADTGRFMEAIMEGKLNEVEPVSVDMFINLNSITDAFQWKHKLPREQK
jgi:hypothetical protein